MWHRRILALSAALCLVPTAMGGQAPTGPSEDDRAYLLRRQQDIFRLNIETDYALALQKLCQTGFGDPSLCSSMTGKSASAPSRPAMVESQPAVTAAPHALTVPHVEEISGIGGDLSAVLRFADGSRHAVRKARPEAAGAVLPGGFTLVAVEPYRVLLRRSGGDLVVVPLAGEPQPDPRERDR